MICQKPVLYNLSSKIWRMMDGSPSFASYSPTELPLICSFPPCFLPLLPPSSHPSSSLFFLGHPWGLLYEAGSQFCKTPVNIESPLHRASSVTPSSLTPLGQLQHTFRSSELHR